MVEFFYHFDYLRDADSLSHTPASIPLALQSQQLPSQGYIIEHAKVFAIAVKYQIDGLRDLAASKFKDAANAYWKHDDFAHSIYIAYDSTTDEVTQLREVVADVLLEHFDDLEQDIPEFETALCEIPRLAYALLKRSRAGSKSGGAKVGEQNNSAVPTRERTSSVRPLPETDPQITCSAWQALLVMQS
jgi:hypothetical protein